MRSIFSTTGKSRAPKRNLEPTAFDITHYATKNGDVVCRVAGRFRFAAAVDAAKRLMPPGPDNIVRLKIGSQELVVTEETTSIAAYKAFGGTGHPNDLITR